LFWDKTCQHEDTKKIIKICRYMSHGYFLVFLLYLISLPCLQNQLLCYQVIYCIVFVAPNYLFGLYIHRITAAESPEATCSSRDILSFNANITYEFGPTTRLSVFIHVMKALASRGLNILLVTEVTLM